MKIIWHHGKIWQKCDKKYDINMKRKRKHGWGWVRAMIFITFAAYDFAIPSIYLLIFVPIPPRSLCMHPYTYPCWWTIDSNLSACMYVCMYFWEAVRGPARARDRVATVGGRGESLITDIVVFVGILALSNADTFAVQGCWQSWVQILCFLQILAFLSGGPTVFTRILPSFRQIHLSLQWLWHPCRCRFFIMNLALSSAPAFVSQRFCPPWVLIACFLRGFWDFECRSLFSEGFWYSWLQIPLCL